MPDRLDSDVGSALDPLATIVAIWFCTAPPSCRSDSDDWADAVAGATSTVVVATAAIMARSAEAGLRRVIRRLS